MGNEREVSKDNSYTSSLSNSVVLVEAPGDNTLSFGHETASHPRCTTCFDPCASEPPLQLRSEEGGGTNTKFLCSILTILFLFSALICLFRTYYNHLIFYPFYFYLKNRDFCLLYSPLYCST